MQEFCPTDQTEQQLPQLLLGTLSARLHLLQGDGRVVALLWPLAGWWAIRLESTPTAQGQLGQQREGV